jgi:2-polyprenyl-6-methoxyphenol hydroxylase-like FAD-dependent oxidoreductase
MKTAVVEAGCVGPIAAACLADAGHRITLVDIDQDELDKIVIYGGRVAKARGAQVYQESTLVKAGAIR